MPLFDRSRLFLRISGVVMKRRSYFVTQVREAISIWTLWSNGNSVDGAQRDAVL